MQMHPIKITYYDLIHSLKNFPADITYLSCRFRGVSVSKLGTFLASHRITDDLIVQLNSEG